MLAAVVLDAAAARWRRLGALCLRRQVPRLWSALFAPPVTAFLYGARLGVAPLTILPTWMWWAATIIGASGGPGTGAAVGATFGATRLATIIGASVTAEGSMSARISRLVRSERPAGVVLALVAVAAAASIVVADQAVPQSPARASFESATSPSDPSAPRRPTAPTPIAERVAPNDSLGSRLVANPGPAFEPADEDAPGLGPLDLQEAAAVEADPYAERALLQTRGFERGYARAWTAADGRVLYAMVYEFVAAGAAAAYLDDGFITLEGRGTRLYDVAEVAGARGFSQVTRDGGESLVSHGVAWTDDDRFFLVFASAPGSRATPGDAVAVARSIAYRG